MASCQVQIQPRSHSPCCCQHPDISERVIGDWSCGCDFLGVAKIPVFVSGHRQTGGVCSEWEQGTAVLRPAHSCAAQVVPAPAP